MKRINVYRVATIGNITIMDKDYGCMTDGHGTTIRILDRLKISPNYLTHYLRAGFGQIQMELIRSFTKIDHAERSFHLCFVSSYFACL